jgi:hypothetical protein
VRVCVIYSHSIGDNIGVTSDYTTALDFVRSTTENTYDSWKGIYREIVVRLNDCWVVSHSNDDITISYVLKEFKVL